MMPDGGGSLLIGGEASDGGGAATLAGLAGLAATPTEEADGGGKGVGELGGESEESIRAKEKASPRMTWAEGAVAICRPPKGSKA